ncbi:MAG: DUF1501 domain-containing protein [Pirellulales bacterium]|nr:DUF1501 domain-containing protein [Pirellulales bacterium]
MFRPPPSLPCALSRRELLLRAGSGFGAVALAWLGAHDGWAMPGPSATGKPGLAPGPAADVPQHRTPPDGHVNPLAPRPPHFAARARSVIWLFLDGGPSHIDLFDPKPALTKLDGQPLPPSVPRPVTAMGRTAHTPLLASKRQFSQHGQSGLWVSDWYPLLARHADELAVIRSCHADGLNHVGSVCQMNTGSILGGKPSLGAWCVYGLGSEADNLPAFVVLADYPEDPPGGGRNWGTGFMPAQYQGTRLREGPQPILHLTPPAGQTAANLRHKLDLLQALNARHQALRPEEDQLAARMAAYELAWRMQRDAPEAIDLASETAATRQLYGLDREETRRLGQCCLLARRLVERGVRFVQIYCGSGSKWDAHRDVEGNHARRCLESDRPFAGLLADLKSRGLLESTLVVWGGEFGRTPMSESGDGRDHNPWGFTVWLAGAHVRPGTYGATDELGLYALEPRVHVRDLHATILHLLGLDHKRLVWPHHGLDERLTGTGGRVLHELVG